MAVSSDSRACITLSFSPASSRPRLTSRLEANIYSGLVCRLLRIPYANNVSGLGTAFIHDSWLYRRVRSLYAFANRGARCVFFQNEEDLQVFNATGLLKGTPTVLLPGSGMDTLRFPFSTLPHEGPFTFVMVARMIADKGVREYMAAAGQVARRHPDARFTMPRQTLLTAGRAARDRIEAQFDERIVVEAALGLVQD